MGQYYLHYNLPYITTIAPGSFRVDVLGLGNKVNHALFYQVSASGRFKRVIGLSRAGVDIITHSHKLGARITDSGCNVG